MKTAGEMRRLEAERAISDLKLRVTRLEHRLSNLQLVCRCEQFEGHVVDAAGVVSDGRLPGPVVS